MFSPKNTGSLNEKVTLNDNAPTANSTQSVTVTGVALPLLSATVKVQSSDLNATLGWPVAFTATVSGSGVAPTGAVKFFAGSTSLGVATVSAGIATLTTNSLAVGSHAITATYSGDATYATASSASIAEVITTTPTLALSVSPDPASAYSQTTLTATVETVSSGATATGTVNFYVDGQDIGVTALTGGVASRQSGVLTPGFHRIDVQYNGDRNYKGIQGMTLWEAVNRQSTSVGVTVSPSNGAVLGTH
jgi:hypothetical protein